MVFRKVNLYSSTIQASIPALASSGILAVMLHHAAAASASVYIQDQIVTILANLAKVGATD